LRTCSWECNIAARKQWQEEKRKNIHRYCKACGKELIPFANNFGQKSCFRNTCSEECSKKIISESKKGELNPMKRTEVAAKMGQTMRETQSENLSQRMKERWENGEIQPPVQSEEQKAATSERMKLNNPMQRPEIAAKQSETMKELFADPEYKLKWLADHTRPPNKFEIRVAEFLNENNLPLKFTGDFAFWIGPCASGQCRNPDFIHTEKGTKKALLAHGRFWHNDQVKVDLELSDYASRGWECFIVWDDDLLDLQMVERIKVFVGEK
jgi:hypothetical protein